MRETTGYIYAKALGDNGFQPTSPVRETTWQMFERPVNQGFQPTSPVRETTRFALASQYTAEEEASINEFMELLNHSD